jgi:hypothetical protein
MMFRRCVNVHKGGWFDVAFVLPNLLLAGRSEFDLMLHYSQYEHVPFLWMELRSRPDTFVAVIVHLFIIYYV